MWAFTVSHTHAAPVPKPASSATVTWSAPTTNSTWLKGATRWANIAMSAACSYSHSDYNHEPGSCLVAVQTSSSSYQKKPDRARAGVRAEDGAERGRDLDLGLRPDVATSSWSASSRSGAAAWAIPTFRRGESVDVSSNSERNSANAFAFPRTRFSGTTSPSRIVRIGFTFSRFPASAAARPMRPPRARYSSVLTVKSRWWRGLVARDERVDLLVGRPALEAALHREREHRERRRDGDASRSRARCRRRAARPRPRRSRTSRRGSRRAGSRGSARTAARAPHRRRGSRPVSAATSSASPWRPRAARRTRRAHVDVVAVALLAEADVERHDAEVGEARLGARGSRRSSRARRPCSRR